MFCLHCITRVSAQPPRPNGIGSEALDAQTPPVMNASPSPMAPTISPAPSPAQRRAPPACRRLACRELSGQCTTDINSIWGQARFAQFSYLGRSSSELATGTGLKSAREISNIVCDQTGNTVNSHGLTDLFTFFGQFLDHNFASTPENEDEEFDIEVPANDPEFSGSLRFRRSKRGFTGDGTDRRPINILSSAVDLVAVYGPNSRRNIELQEFTSNGDFTGKLKTSGDDLLPRNNANFFNSPDSSPNFFLAGDHRSNETPLLTAMHTIFLREHNRLADLVIERIPSLPPRQVFEYARKLNIAQFQKIVYEEFYPAILQRTLLPYRGLNRRTDPTISDIFAGAAFRIGHTLVGERFTRRGANGTQLAPIERSNSFFWKADSFNSDELDSLVRGAANNPAQEVDEKVVDLLRNFLFKNVPQENGLDLIALNIQRGRDHALPKFNEIRALFGIPKAPNFRSISRKPEVVRKLSEAYNNNIDDVEAFVGLIAEDHIPGSGMGRTMAALWRAEFTRLRDGDQFFYLNSRRLPTLLRARFRDFERRLLRRNINTFRDVILNNTNLVHADLPSGNIFNLRK